MANVYLPDETLKRLKRLARASGYSIKRGPKSQIGDFILRLMADFETARKSDHELPAEPARR